MSDTENSKAGLPQRLCSEIQLFDLCDLTACTFKTGRFCTNPDLISRFEKIADEELRAPERFVSGDLDEDEFSDDEDAYDDEMDDFAGAEDEGWEDEE